MKIRTGEHGLASFLLLVLRVLITFGCSLITYYFFVGKINTVLILLLTGIITFIQLRPWEALELRSRVLTSVFATLFSAALVAGRKININSNSFKAFKIYDLLYLAAISVICYILFSRILSFLLYKGAGIIQDENSDAKKPRFVGLICFLTLILCWAPFFMMSYPGVTTVDSANVLGQATGMYPLSDWHPFTYTFLVRVATNLGTRFGDISIGVAIFSFAQMSFMAISLTYAFVWMYRQGIRRLWLVVAVAYFAISPVFAVHSVTMWKDIPFAALVLLYTIYLLKIVSTNGEQLCSIWGSIKYVLIAIAMSLFRHNGFYVLILTTLVLLSYLIIRNWKSSRKAILRMLPALLAVIMIVPLVQYFYSSIGVKKAQSTEAYSIPVQQIARTVVQKGNFTKEQSESLRRVFDIEKLLEYDPFLADPAKNSINQEYVSVHKTEILVLWASLLPANLSEYIRAYAMQTYGYWYPGLEPSLVDSTANAASEMDVVKVNWVENLTGFNVNVNGAMKDFLSIGSMVWIMLFLCLILVAKRNYQTFLSLIPVIAVWLTLMVASPLANGFRYIFALPFALPVLIFISLTAKSKEKRNVK